MPQAKYLSWRKDFESIAASLDKESPEKAASLEKLEELRVDLLGRGGRLTELLKALKDLSLEQRRELGPGCQALKSDLEARLARRKEDLERAADLAVTPKGACDLTLPALPTARGRIHPLTATLQEMTKTLRLMGFSCAEGPLVETERNNFEALNIPAHHPARDMQDTFYLQDVPLLLRTHTSPVQIRSMESARPPLRIISPGRVFRRDAVDATHSAVFHQVEGLAVDKNLSFAELKGTLQAFMRGLFGSSTALRFRPSYFPFTEPSAEVDVKCFFCSGSGCAVCKRSGWIEMLGCGMVHPKVFEAVDYDPQRWSGFAFGIGVERVAMLRLGVADIRLFYENDLRFLRQFDEAIA